MKTRPCVLGVALVLGLLASQERCVVAGARKKKPQVIQVVWEVPYRGPQGIKLSKRDKVKVSWDYSDKKSHNVVLLANEAAYTDCDFTKAKVLQKDCNKTTFTILWPGKKKIKFYACSVDAKRNKRGHCSAGQKLAISGV